jgi:hypothetical protein
VWCFGIGCAHIERMAFVGRDYRQMIEQRVNSKVVDMSSEFWALEYRSRACRY